MGYNRAGKRRKEKIKRRRREEERLSQKLAQPGETQGGPSHSPALAAKEAAQTK